jgi:hypothetical protein
MGGGGGGGKRGLITQSSRSFLDLTSREKQNFIFTILETQKRNKVWNHLTIF